jgi:nicotinate-nucleotide adenylyltransferase
MTGNKLDNKIFDYIYKKLSYERYNHTINVCKLAVKLAHRYNTDPYNVQIAALLHDCAKNMSLEESKKYISQRKIYIKYADFLYRHAPQVLHSYIGADIAEKQFKIINGDILNAIKHHTVGRTGMSVCEKIIFVADSLSPDRKFNKNIVSGSQLFDDLDKSFLLVLKNKINYIISKFQILHPDVINVWNYYNK